ncbi:Gas vesicle synthesis protein GvpO [Nonomuraea solani]|uniref:Gas vesicle synthesis protein GvpO n=1 Tax=Nonomuraea solani TaxID=1144553 RepID=A0A1H6ENR6_9ACTN|nr:gas vesicle protein GvpO [Nonomuraea solani]SEG99472.1 Gas vesicle synthesis protein GvpO [Nonomuraea solani]
MTARRSVAEKPRASGEAAAKEKPAALTAVTAGGMGVRHVSDLTTKEVEGITSVDPADDGWMVNVEVVEDRRIPSSGDILAVYQVKIDQEGSLLSYRRTSRYRRSNGEAF